MRVVSSDGGDFDAEGGSGEQQLPFHFDKLLHERRKVGLGGGATHARHHRRRRF